MKVHVHIAGIQADDRLRGRLASEVQALNDLIPVASAEVSLACQHLTTPPYQAVVLLGVPGPDIHAAARDHTWPAAWLKVMDRVRAQITRRRERQQSHAKSRRGFHTQPAPCRGPAGA